MMLNEIHIKGQAMESDEEGNADHFSPQTLLETPDTEMQYSIRSAEGEEKRNCQFIKKLSILYLK